MPFLISEYVFLTFFALWNCTFGEYTIIYVFKIKVRIAVAELMQSPDF